MHNKKKRKQKWHQELPCSLTVRSRSSSFGSTITKVCKKKKKKLYSFISFQAQSAQWLFKKITHNYYFFFHCSLSGAANFFFFSWMFQQGREKVENYTHTHLQTLAWQRESVRKWRKGTEHTLVNSQTCESNWEREFVSVSVCVYITHLLLHYYYKHCCCRLLPLPPKCEWTLAGWKEYKKCSAFLRNQKKKFSKSNANYHLRLWHLFLAVVVHKMHKFSPYILFTLRKWAAAGAGTHIKSRLVIKLFLFLFSLYSMKIIAPKGASSSGVNCGKLLFT